MAIGCRSHQPVTNPGTRITLFGPAWVRLSVLTIVAAAVMYIVCRSAGAFQSQQILGLADKSWQHWLIVKLPTVVGQQIMLQILLVPVLLRLFSRTRIAVVAGAAIFALLHLPNPLLVLFTFVAGTIWISAYFRSRQLAPIILSHLVLAVLAAGLCGEYIFGMRVGPTCMSLFPRRIVAGGTIRYEFPGCVVGRAERLVQHGDQLIMEGWALDPIHRASPTAMWLKIGGQLHEIESVEYQRVPAVEWANAERSGFVQDYCYSYVARIPASWVQANQEVQLFAANANGYLGRIEQMGAITSVKNCLAGQPIVLFPVEVDGRINQFVQRADGVHLTGWVADLRDRSLLDKLCLEYDGQIRTFDLGSVRRNRPDIAKALDAPILEQSGFDVGLEPASIFQLKNLRCFAIDRQKRLHRIPLTEHAETDVAKLTDSVDDNQIWR